LMARVWPNPARGGSCRRHPLAASGARKLSPLILRETMSCKHTTILKVDRHYLRGSESMELPRRPMNAWKATLETAVGLFRFRRARGLRIAAVCAGGGGRRRARFDSDSLRAGPGLRVARRERTER
jgi:hypothetical protein